MKEPHKPRLQEDALEAGSVAHLRPDASADTLLFDNIDASALTAPGMSLDETILRHVVLAEANIEKLGLRDTELQRCDITAARCAEASWVRVRAGSCRMQGG